MRTLLGRIETLGFGRDRAREASHQSTYASQCGYREAIPERNSVHDDSWLVECEIAIDGCSLAWRWSWWQEERGEVKKEMAGILRFRPVEG